MMITDPILAFEEGDRVKFVRQSSGHDVDWRDVRREGFHASPGATELLLKALQERKGAR